MNYDNENLKSIWAGLALFILLFVIPYFCRQGKTKEREQNKRYTIGVITERPDALFENRRDWYYEFYYNHKKYQSSRRTHVGYDVKLGDYFLVEFSSKNPDNNKILYEFQLRPDKIESKSYVGDTIPNNILRYNKKKDRLW
jgi:hypothetical protein